MGIFRWSGLAVLAGFILLIWLFLAVWIDSWVESGVENQGSQLNGASVNVDDASLGWLLNGLTVNSLAIANPDDLMKNRVMIDQIKLNVSLLSLFKKQLHVNELSLTNVKVNQPRSTPAKKYEPLGITEPDTWEWPKASLEAVQSIDTDAVLAKLDIQSPSRFKQFSEQLGTTKANWQEQQASLPDEEKVRQLEAEYQALQSQLKKANALEKVAVLKDIKSFIKKVKAEQDKIKKFKNSVEKGIASSKKQWKELQGLIEKDAELALSMASLSPDGMRHIASRLLGANIAHWLELILKNSQRFKASAESSEKEVVEPREGITVPFGNQVVLPSFWVHQSTISGDFYFAEQQGRISGDIKNLGSGLVESRPMSSKIKLELPSFDSKTGLGELAVTVKKTANKVNLSGNVSLKDWPVKSWQLGSNQLGLENILLSSDLSIQTNDISTDLVFEITLGDYTVKTSEKPEGYWKYMVELLQSSKVISLTGRLIKQNGETKLVASSNLDMLFFNRIKQELNEKAKQFESKVKRNINSQLSDVRSKIQQQLTGLEDFDQLLTERLSSLEKLE
ncbi:MAG: TIGR03545 family protein [Gammaproteobacteria bacterium]|nr:TIGR03545 family protein [Gammaproteobacteria bacterium]